MMSGLSKEEPDFSKPDLKTLEYIIWGYDGNTSIYDLIENWYKAMQEKLLTELAVSINPRYSGWHTDVSEAKIQAYLRFLGLTKAEAWKIIKEQKLGDYR